MNVITPFAVLVLLAGPAISETWNCAVPYDEVNGGGTLTIQDDRLTFVSNWPHREPETLKCIRTGLRSECMSAKISMTRTGGKALFTKIYSIIWQSGGAPESVTVKQPSALFREDNDGLVLTQAFPAIGHTFPVTDCRTE
ncbi:hypothetical protein [Lacimonas salitolerans]|uniref:Secreted protein n=1 Tax=Lacimonas salitolerans TaxID=1323750 RepID=A0ABW4EF63_9RHOB